MNIIRAGLLFVGLSVPCASYAQLSAEQLSKLENQVPPPPVFNLNSLIPAPVHRKYSAHKIRAMNEMSFTQWSADETVWLERKCRRVADPNSHPDEVRANNPAEVESAVLWRLKADRSTSDESITGVVSAWVTYEVFCRNIPGLSASAAKLLDTQRVYAEFAPFLSDRIYVKARLSEEMGLGFQTLGLREEDISADKAAETGMRDVSEDVVLHRIRTLINGADSEKALGQIQAADTDYNEAAGYPWYNVESSNFDDFRELHILALGRLIEVRRGNLAELQRFYLYPVEDSLRPLLEQELKDAGDPGTK